MTARWPLPSGGAQHAERGAQVVERAAELGVDGAQAFEHDAERLGGHRRRGEPAEGGQVGGRPERHGCGVAAADQLRP